MLKEWKEGPRPEHKPVPKAVQRCKHIFKQEAVQNNDV